MRERYLIKYTGGWLPISAKIVKGKKVTSFFAIKVKNILIFFVFFAFFFFCD
jgi:hypothetical protein